MIIILTRPFETDTSTHNENEKNKFMHHQYELINNRVKSRLSSKLAVAEDASNSTQLNSTQLIKACSLRESLALFYSPLAEMLRILENVQFSVPIPESNQVFDGILPTCTAVGTIFSGAAKLAVPEVHAASFNSIRVRSKLVGSASGRIHP